MESAVYVLSAITSSICMLLLVRGYLASRSRLLMWSAACFGGLALNNVLLVVDLLVLPDVDLSVLRALVMAAAFLVLTVGLIWEAP
jgi:hypothetical protein